MIVKKNKNICQILIIALLILFCTAGNGQASLAFYLDKHKSLRATPKQIEKIDKYDDLIRYFSSLEFFRPDHKVNPDFIRALILAESNCAPEAQSHKNARGLAQILYSTGKEAAKDIAQWDTDLQYVKKSQLNNLQPEDLYDPAINILLACYLVSKYNYYFSGRLDLVVAAWNAGGGSIKHNHPPQYKETLNLIGKVNGYFKYFLRQRKRI